MKHLTTHLNEVELTYFQHLLRTCKFALWSLKMFFVSVIHGIFPFLLTRTFSSSVEDMAQKIAD